MRWRRAGGVVTLEFVPDEDGVSPPSAAMFSMVMLVSTPKGKAYRFSELDAMHRAAGFVDCALVGTVADAATAGGGKEGLKTLGRPPRPLSRGAGEGLPAT